MRLTILQISRQTSLTGRGVRSACGHVNDLIPTRSSGPEVALTSPAGALIWFFHRIPPSPISGTFDSIGRLRTTTCRSGAGYVPRWVEKRWNGLRRRPCAFRKNHSHRWIKRNHAGGCSRCGQTITRRTERVARRSSIRTGPACRCPMKRARDGGRVQPGFRAFWCE